MNVTFGISPECLCHDVRDNVRRVRALEEAGFDYIWEGDHTLPWQHSSGHSAGIFTTLEAFLPMSADPAYRRSALASSFVAALELARQGRLELGQDEPFADLMVRAVA